MDRKIFSIIAIFLFILGGVFAATITINGGDYTISPSVTARIQSTLDQNYCVTTEDTNTACSWTLSTSDDFNINATLTSGDGTGKTLYLYTQNGASYATVSDTITLDSTAPTVTYSISDGNYFNSSTKPATITISFSDATTIVTSSSIKLDGNVKTSPISMADVNDGTHTILVDANDSAGNRLQGSISFTIDTQAPAISSIPSVSWTNDSTPEITINATDNGSSMSSGTALIYCTSEGSAEQFSFSSSKVTSFNITSDADCNGDDGNKPIFIKIRDNAGNTSSIVKSYILFDDTAPSPPMTISLTEGDRQITVEWAAPSADNASGNKEYRLYKNGEQYATTTNLNYTVSSLNNGTEYSFKVSTIDNAGNESSNSSIVTGVPTENDNGATVTVTKSGSNVTYAKDNDTLLVSCSLENESDNVKLRYRYEANTVQDLTDEEDDTDYIEESINVDASYNRISFWCEWESEGTDYDSTTTTIYLDEEAPNIEWGSFSNTITGTQNIWITVTDNKNISSVEFEFNGIKRGTTKSGSTYSWNLNSTEVNNGNHTLKAIAKDEAGNERVVTKTITIENELNEEQEALQAINNAKTAKQETEDLIKYFNEKGLEFDENFLNDKATADTLLNEAESVTDNITKKDKANQAKALYEQINNSAIIEPTAQEAIYEFNAEKLTEKLYALGLSQGQVEEASALILSGNVIRKLSIVKVGEKYYAQIEISISLDGNDETYKIVEVIPKEFVNSASQIFSGMDFNILEDDPVIEFTIPKDTQKIYYSINVDEETANKLIDNNVIALFSAPPIIMSSEDTLTITKGIDMTLLTIIGVIIVIILIGIIVIAYVGRPKNGFEQKTQSSLSNKIKDKVKIGNKDSKGKWKYKG